MTKHKMNSNHHLDHRKNHHSVRPGDLLVIEGHPDPEKRSQSDRRGCANRIEANLDIRACPGSPVKVRLKPPSPSPPPPRTQRPLKVPSLPRAPVNIRWYQDDDFEYGPANQMMADDPGMDMIPETPDRGGVPLNSTTALKYGIILLLVYRILDSAIHRRELCVPKDDAFGLLRLSVRAAAQSLILLFPGSNVLSTCVIAYVMVVFVAIIMAIMVHRDTIRSFQVLRSATFIQIFATIVITSKVLSIFVSGPTQPSSWGLGLGPVMNLMFSALRF